MIVNSVMAPPSPAFWAWGCWTLHHGERVQVQRNRPRTQAAPIPGARPLPLFRADHKTLADGVGVKVVDGRMEGAARDEDTVVAGTVLPEVIRGVLLARLEHAEAVRIVLSKVEDGLPGDGLFHGAEEIRDIGGSPRGPNEKVDVVGHEDVGPQMERVKTAGTTKGLGEVLASAFRGDKWTVPVAGEGQLMNVAGLSGVLDAFELLKASRHGGNCVLR